MISYIDYEPNVLVDTKDMEESIWLSYRKKGIGGSDAAAVCGCSSFKTITIMNYRFATIWLS